MRMKTEKQTNTADGAAHGVVRRRGQLQNLGVA